MRNKILLGALFAGLLATGVAFFVRSPEAVAADPAGTNLKVLPKGMSKPELKKVMKSISTALGVQCDHCHNTDDMAADTPKKEEARAMMKMVSELNKQYFKGEPRITCMTCHNGAKKPKK